jgi:hypothetical protein
VEEFHHLLLEADKGKVTNSDIFSDQAALRHIRKDVRNSQCPITIEYLEEFVDAIHKNSGSKIRSSAPGTKERFPGHEARQTILRKEVNDKTRRIARQIIISVNSPL